MNALPRPQPDQAHPHRCTPQQGAAVVESAWRINHSMRCALNCMRIPVAAGAFSLTQGLTDSRQRLAIKLNMWID